MSVIVRNYGDFDDFKRFWVAENKANQTQSQFSPQTSSGGWKNKANLFRIECCVMRIAKVIWKNKANVNIGKLALVKW